MNTKRPLVWPITLVLGGGDALLASIGGPLGYLFALAALPLAWRGRVSGGAGLLVGFGGKWLLLMANQFASGGRLPDPAPWLAVCAVPLGIGVTLAIVEIGRTHADPNRGCESIPPFISVPRPATVIRSTFARPGPMNMCACQPRPMSTEADEVDQPSAEPGSAAAIMRITWPASRHRRAGPEGERSEHCGDGGDDREHGHQADIDRLTAQRRADDGGQHADAQQRGERLAVLGRMPTRAAASGTDPPAATKAARTST